VRRVLRAGLNDENALANGVKRAAGAKIAEETGSNAHIAHALHNAAGSGARRHDDSGRWREQRVSQDDDRQALLGEQSETWRGRWVISAGATKRDGPAYQMFTNAGAVLIVVIAAWWGRGRGIQMAVLKATAALGAATRSGMAVVVL
jgi:hypothetical protein